jgi:hypothetical protein
MVSDFLTRTGSLPLERVKSFAESLTRTDSPAKQWVLTPDSISEELSRTTSTFEELVTLDRWEQLMQDFRSFSGASVDEAQLHVMLEQARRYALITSARLING